MKDIIPQLEETNEDNDTHNTGKEIEVKSAVCHKLMKQQISEMEENIKDIKDIKGLKREMLKKYKNLYEELGIIIEAEKKEKELIKLNFTRVVNYNNELQERILKEQMKSHSLWKQNMALTEGSLALSRMKKQLEVTLTKVKMQENTDLNRVVKHNKELQTQVEAYKQQIELLLKEQMITEASNNKNVDTKESPKKRQVIRKLSYEKVLARRGGQPKKQHNYPKRKRTSKMKNSDFT